MQAESIGSDMTGRGLDNNGERNRLRSMPLLRMADILSPFIYKAGADSGSS